LMNRIARSAWSHSRDVTCWFESTRVCYIIPQYFKNERVLGANLEVEIDLEKPAKYYVLERSEHKTFLKPVMKIDETIRVV